MYIDIEDMVGAIFIAQVKTNKPYSSTLFSFVTHFCKWGEEKTLWILTGKFVWVSLFEKGIVSRQVSLPEGKE